MLVGYVLALKFDLNTKTSWLGLGTETMFKH